MKKKILPNLSLALKPNTDGNAMLQALEGAPKSAEAPAEVQAAPVAQEDMTAPREVAPFDHRRMGVGDLKVGVVYDLPLSMLVRSDNNARVFYKPGEVEEMAENLSTKGQKVAAIGYVRDNAVVIIDGQKRFNACTLGKMPTLKVYIQEQPESAIDEYETSRYINTERSTQTPFDDAIRWAKFLDAKLYASQDELAKRLKMSAPAVSKSLGLNRIPMPLRRMMADEPQTSLLSVAYEISNIFSNLNDSNAEELEAIGEEVIKTVIKKGLGRMQTIELVRSKLEGKKTRVRGDTVQVKFGEHRGDIKVVPSRGEFSLSFKGLNESEIEELKRRVEAVLAGQMTM
ncbi:ParB N-terminal domain-containing protein [Hydrogenophaga sp.]|uniref:ParB/RepB/Spo0J family partition protein n=1 Tax=Hydrogenophaga sp. TaxID=1904254 RepID=UPI0026181C8F|nr:ParB N-terminal domain-containing protein [Hydrogenophaga sp.]